MKHYPEYKESGVELINQAVTKGLDPNVEMKPSGVEWIGEIPAHWEVRRLKYIADLNMGQSPPSEQYNSDKIGTPFLQGNAEFGLYHPTPKIYCPTAKKYASPGDILLSVRAPVGAINVADQEYGIGRGLCAIRPRTNQLEYHYTKYLIKVVCTQLHIVATGSTYDAVTVDDVSNVTCVVPPFSEQTQIANFLDQKTQQIDELITAEQRKIELLKEYRQSLISEAVTGKIDVRNEV
ncbi:MAG: restriction endonuclease subunit S [Candidatus Poribacteria bacterium]|nr:restriction endonuclease subunit S [Candidatus Poribacteria bacterium]